VNDGLRRRVDRVGEEVAFCRDRHADITGQREDEYWHAYLGRETRELAEGDGIPCWTAAEDGLWREWSMRQAGPELREILSVLHGALVRRALRDELPVTGFDLTDPWADEDPVVAPVTDSLENDRHHDSK
jgi:hypothetical protein